MGISLKVVRDRKTAYSTGGILSTVLSTDGPPGYHCYTLEPPTRTDDVKPRAIPAGIVYRLTLRWSEKHGRLIPHIEGVPGFTAIEMHIGCFPKDTLGCTLVGNTRGTDFVGQSHGAFDELFKILWLQVPVEKYCREQDAVYEVGTITFEDAA